MEQKVMGIDPGQKGAIVMLHGKELVQAPIPYGEDSVDYEKLVGLIEFMSPDFIFLERAVPLAMGAKHAFNYGRDFMAIELAVKQSKRSVTYVEPNKWVKVMHQGINADLKPKAKSLIAIERLCSHLVQFIPKGPKSGKLDEGVVDAILIAEYGKRVLNHL